MNSKNELPLVLYRFDQPSARDEFIHSFGNDFELLLCESDIEAQVELEKYGQKVNAVLVEQDTIHSSLLEMSKALSPQSLCILLHKNIALDEIVSLLEQGAVDKCFAKPYNCHVIRSEIYAAHMGVQHRYQTGVRGGGVDTRYYALIVDDEPLATHYLKKQLDKLNCPCEVIVADDAVEALVLFRQYKDSLALVISDQRMPGMLGNQLLTEILNHNPSVIRILTSAYEEVDVALNAVNEGQIFRYIRKPWNAEKICSCIEIALAEFLLKRGQMNDQLSLLDKQFQQIVSNREIALLECFGNEVDAYAGKGSLQYFFNCLVDIETLPPTFSSLKASKESSLEGELVSVFSQAVLTKLSKVSKQTEFTKANKLRFYEVLSELVQGTVLQFIASNEDPVGAQILTSLQQLLESSGFGFVALELEHKDEIVMIQTKFKKDISTFKHILSALTRLTPQMIEQQSSMLMLVLVVRHLGGSIVIKGGKQQFSLCMSLPNMYLPNDHLC